MVRLPAYILAGGESRRYGQDKTLISWDGKPLILRTVATARKVASRVKIVAHERDKFEFTGIPVLLDVVERVGPLGGLLTALEDCPVERCLILASDMPFLTAEWLSKISNIRADAPVVFSQSSRGVEPLCAIYSKATLPFWWEQYRSKNLRLQKGIQQLGGVRVEFENRLETRPPFFNLNEPDALP